MTLLSPFFTSLKNVWAKLRGDNFSNPDMISTLSDSAEFNLNLRVRLVEQLLPNIIHSDADSAYDYVHPEFGSFDIETVLLKTLSKTALFNRLADVRFLGALDYCLIQTPNGRQKNRRFTRYQHSLGVAALAKSYLSKSNHSDSDRLLCVAAAALHDLGHPPFSHTIEPLFKEYFGLDHHNVTQSAILGENGFSKEIWHFLNGLGVSPFRVVDILNGDDEVFDLFFSGPINFDTIEGILRSKSYFKLDFLGLTPTRVVDAAFSRGQRGSKATVDGFWACKDDMYNVVIRSPSGVFFDTLFQNIARDLMEKGQLTAKDFISTEEELFKKLPVFRKATQARYWGELSDTYMTETITFQQRSFYVDESIPFTSRMDHQRYRQSKKSLKLTLKN